MHSDTVYLFDLGTRYLVEGDGFALVEHTLPPRALGSPLHRHTSEDEYSYVLEGRLGAQLGDGVVEAGPGELAPVLAAGDHDGVQEIAARYELEIDFSTIPALAERHGLNVEVPA